MQGGICDDSGLVLYSLFLLGDNYNHPNNSILNLKNKFNLILYLKNTVMDRTDYCINYIFRPEKTIGMLVGKRFFLACLCG